MTANDDSGGGSPFSLFHDEFVRFVDNNDQAHRTIFKTVHATAREHAVIAESVKSMCRRMEVHEKRLDEIDLERANQAGKIRVIVAVAGAVGGLLVTVATFIVKHLFGGS